jgi:hypothetical protein
VGIDDFPDGFNSWSAFWPFLGLLLPGYFVWGTLQHFGLPLHDKFWMGLCIVLGNAIFFTAVIHLFIAGKKRLKARGTIAENLARNGQEKYGN